MTASRRAVLPNMHREITGTWGQPFRNPSEKDTDRTRALPERRESRLDPCGDTDLDAKFFPSLAGGGNPPGQAKHEQNP